MTDDIDIRGESHLPSDLLTMVLLNESDQQVVMLIHNSTSSLATGEAVVWCVISAVLH